ncbi:DUF4174 domain-containing protein [Gracilimonas sp.]|uniref:DUF4174 domain-containing protein n=1 Tax=Gracilimonas sp. TaxID=1974203 RepID=UPI0028714039|nr:DUF4174 domain-containing protein [Gracilimonas sp.]
MKLLFSAILLVSLLFTSMISTAQDFNIDDHKWKDRVLLIFSPNTYNQDYRDQVDYLDDAQEGIKERDLKAYYVLKESSASVRGQVLENEDSDYIRSEYGISPSDFTVILIGKDGTEKLRIEEALSTKRLFKEIDAMPMRKLEMKDDGK